LHVDTCGIHIRDPAVPEIAHFIEDLGRIVPLFEMAPWTIKEGRGREVLFKRDRSGRRL
jgi:hypothetical protein